MSDGSAFTGGGLQRLTTDLHSTFNHEALESSDARFHKRHKLVLQVH